MDGPNKEMSPAPSVSSKGFKGVIGKARIGRKDDPYLTSLNGTDDGSERSGIRSSVDSLMDRARASRNSSIDEGGIPPGPSSLSKLIPGRVKKKRKRREEAVLQLETEEGPLGRGRSVEDSTATAAVSQPQLSANRSQSSIGGDGTSSLITVDSDNESPDVARPPMASHESHVGYLTTSSPLIKINTTAEETPANLQLEDPQFEHPDKTNTLPATSSTPASSSNLAPQHAATFNTRRADRSPSTDKSRSRGVSPGAKIREVFTPGSKKKGSSPPKSPDRTSIKSGLGKAFAGLADKGRNRSDLSLGQGSQASDSVPSLNIDASKSTTTNSVRDLPPLNTAPRTPPSTSLEAPETTVTPPTPTDGARRDSQSSPSARNSIGSAGINPNAVVSPSGNMISHRRIRSDSASHGPSKLSNAMSAPLTPMIEEGKTPGGTRSPSGATQGSQAGGFFSSVFTVAQNAATTLQNTISNQPRSRSSTQTNEELDPLQESEMSTSAVSEGEADPIDEKKPLAIETLGSGGLSLSDLGIASDTPATNASASGIFPNGISEKARNGVTVQREEAAARAEDASAARAVSAAYSEKPASDIATPVAEDRSIRPRSPYESSIMTGDKTPPNGSLYEVDHGVRRSGSVRSRVGAVSRRHRNSSSATGGAIGAAIAAGHSALANPAAAPRAPAGYAVATKKRNRDFHQLFRSVPENSNLIEDYSCALQRDIILAGRIYVSDTHICFSSNILGWVTTLIISFDEIVSVEKENTAMVFPNAIAFQTLNQRHTFRSLLSREATYDLIIAIWRISHPNLKSSLNGARLDQGGTGDKTEKLDPSGSDETSEITDEEEDIYEPDEDPDEDVGSVTENGGGSLVSEVAAEPVTNGASRKASAMGAAAGAAATSGPTVSDAKAGEKAAAAASAASVDFPGPATHAPTECSDSDNHYDKFLKDDIIPASLGKVYSMVFGPASGGFMAKWLLDEIKVTELQMEDDKKGLSEENKSRSFTYIKPLYASIGPKSTKCVVTETLDSIDLDKAVSVTASTQTPDVPSGNVFVTKTRFCFMWAPGNQTRVLMNFTIEWSGKSWLKGPIEKGAADGQITYCNDLVKALKAGVTSRSRASTKSKPISKGGKRLKNAPTTPKAASPPSAVTTTTSSSWGPLEPIHAIVSPIADIMGPLVNTNAIIAILVSILLFNYLRPTPRAGVGYPLSHPERIAAYEELWRREESDLWDWLDQRVAVPYSGTAGSKGPSMRKKKKERDLKTRVRELRMSEREVEHAITVTEERLGVLRRAILGKETEGAEKESSAGEDGGGEV